VAAYFPERSAGLDAARAAALGSFADEYASFGEITADIDDALVYGGIHFRFDPARGRAPG
jgi:hypothetical protein